MLSTSDMIMMNTATATATATAAADWNHHQPHRNHNSYYYGHDQLIKLRLHGKRHRRTPYYNSSEQAVVISRISHEQQQLIKTDKRKKPTITTSIPTQVEENQLHHTHLVFVSSSSAERICIECKTSKTPLWRGGPAGPKTLCNACGIRDRKRRRRDVGSLLFKGNNMSIQKEEEVVLTVEKVDDPQLEAAKAALLLMAMSSGAGGTHLCIQS